MATGDLVIDPGDIILPPGGDVVIPTGDIKIATEQYVYNIGKQGTPETNRCCTKARALALGGVFTLSGYQDNQLVPEYAIQAPVVVAPQITISIWYAYRGFQTIVTKEEINTGISSTVINTTSQTFSFDVNINDNLIVDFIDLNINPTTTNNINATLFTVEFSDCTITNIRPTNNISVYADKTGFSFSPFSRDSNNDGRYEISIASLLLNLSLKHTNGTTYNTTMRLVKSNGATDNPLIPT